MVQRTWKVKEVVVQELTEPMKMLEECRIWYSSELCLCNQI